MGEDNRARPKNEIKKKIVEKKEKRVEKYVRMISQALVIEGRVQKSEFDPSCCMNLPLCLKVDFCH